MTRHTKLVSASARGLLSSGLYTFYFDNDNQLKLIYNGHEVSSVYWPDPFTTPLVNHRTTYNSSQYGVLEQTGRFAASDGFNFAASDLGDNVMRRLTLDYDGNLKLYSLTATTLDGVRLVGLLDGVPQATGASDWSKGCRRKANLRATQDFSFRKVAGADFIGYDLLYWERVTIQNCKHLCLDIANCQAFGYRQGEGKCFTKVYLFNGKNFPNPHTDIYVKVPKGMLLSSSELASHKVTHACQVHQKEANTSSLMFQDGSSNFKFGYFLTSALTLLFIEVVLIIVGCWVAHKWGTRPEIIDEGYTIISSQFRIFSYRELQKATNCFQEELGSGGSGAVYKGVLDDERKAAVKKLNDVMQGEQEFRSEISVIGRIYHMNLVRIWGFCVEKTHRLLVSELLRIVPWPWFFLITRKTLMYSNGAKGTILHFGWQKD
uniref:non-specific serine/threonine protein kinase n=1 Tax=Hordeum vulgare subsp. vulgare TaxID=112509 RepID=A0A8I6Z7F2_HORVV